jgi:hypothetical protein
MGKDGRQLKHGEFVDDAIALSRLLLSLADREACEAEGDDYLVLSSVLRDSAFKIRRTAEGFRVTSSAR